MVHRALDGRVELNHVDGEAGALCERAELVVDGLDLDGVERDEGRLPGTLYAHILERHCQHHAEVEFTWNSYFDALDSRLLFVDDHSVDVAPENDGHGRLVLPLCGFTEVDDPPANTCDVLEDSCDTCRQPGRTWEDALQVRECLLHLRLTLGLLLIHTRLEELVVHVYELFVDLLLEIPGTPSAGLRGIARRTHLRDPRPLGLLLL